MIQRYLGLAGIQEPHEIPKNGHMWVPAVRWMFQEDARPASVVAALGRRWSRQHQQLVNVMFSKNLQ